MNLIDYAPAAALRCHGKVRKGKFPVACFQTPKLKTDPSARLSRSIQVNGRSLRNERSEQGSPGSHRRPGCRATALLETNEGSEQLSPLCRRVRRKRTAAFAICARQIEQHLLGDRSVICGPRLELGSARCGPTLRLLKGVHALGVQVVEAIDHCRRPHRNPDNRAGCPYKRSAVR